MALFVLDSYCGLQFLFQDIFNLVIDPLTVRSYRIRPFQIVCVQAQSQTPDSSTVSQKIHHFSQSYIKKNITMSYGGKAAERLSGKIALITGASAGIGRATAFELAHAANGNLKLVLTARRLEKLQEVKKELELQYPRIQVLVQEFDVSDLDSIKPFVTNLPKEFSDIDILVNNAGKALGREEVGQIAAADIREMFDTNVLALITLTQELLPLFKAKNAGDIVNLGSIAGRDPYPGGAIYCPTKAAVKSFSHALRKELISTKIRVIEIDPGNVETEFSNVRFRGDHDKAKAVYAGTEPLVADDIAELITFAVTRRENTVVAETLVFSTNQASASHLYRSN